MKEKLGQEIDNTFRVLLKTLLGFKQSEIDLAPPDGGWSAGQCTEHILKSISGLPKVCDGRTENVQRRMNEKIETIEGVFLNFDTHFQSPDFVKPSETKHKLSRMIVSLENTKVELLRVANTHDLHLTCKDFEVPGFGPFTKYELLSFALMHTQRHTRQLEIIKSNLNATI